MFPTDPLSTLLACTFLLSLGGIAIFVLPWSDEELEASEGAWRFLLALPERWRSKAPPAPPPACHAPEVPYRRAA